MSPDILVVQKVVPFAGGRKGLAVQNAAGVLTSWATVVFPGGLQWTV